MDTFYFLKYMAQLVTPPGLLLVGLVAGVLLAAIGWVRLGRFVALLAVGQAVLVSLQPVSELLILPLENEARRMAAASPPCCYDAIVILGGALTPATPPLRPHPHITDSADRVWHAVRLFKQGLAPRIILSGGTLPVAGENVGSEAEAMRLMLRDFGVPDDRIVVEGNSLNTIENIREIRAIVGTAQVALVTSGYHMPRAMKLARLAGLNAQAFPTDWRAVSDAQTSWTVLLPSIEAMGYSWLGIKEYLALALDMRGNSLKP